MKKCIIVSLYSFYVQLTFATSLLELDLNLHLSYEMESLNSWTIQKIYNLFYCR